jgi:alpha-1,3-rhamnosyltransferase
MSEASKHSSLVSVVIPCYNHARYLKECIMSVIAQDFRNIELIIIDDGSKDASVQVIDEMRGACEARFTRFEFIPRENRGLCNTLNQALEWCEGEYYAALASDDIWLPFKLRTQVEYLKAHPEVVAVFGGITLIDERGVILRKVEKPGSFGFKDIIKIEDWNMWLKLAKPHGQLVSLRESVTFYRQHQHNISGDAEMMHEEGVKILAQFSDDTDYQQAVAEHDLAVSSMLAFKEKTKAVRYFLAYLRAHRYSSRALPVLIKILIPSFFLRSKL